MPAVPITVRVLTNTTHGGSLLWLLQQAWTRQPSEEEQEEAWRLYGKQAEAIWYLAPMEIWRALKSLHPEVQSNKLPGRPQIERRIKRLRKGKNYGLNNELLGLIENKQLNSVDVIRFYSSKNWAKSSMAVAWI